MITINLLPIKAQGTKYLTLVFFGLLSLICLVDLGLTMLEEHLQTKIKEAESSVEFSTSQEYFMFSEERPDLEYESRQIQKNLQELNQKISLLERRPWSVATVLEELVTCLPEELWLTQIEHQKEGQLLIQGQSLTYEPILVWLDRLAQQAGIYNVQPIYLKGEGVNQFTVRIEVGE